MEEHIKICTAEESKRALNKEMLQHLRDKNKKVH